MATKKKDTSVANDYSAQKRALQSQLNSNGTQKVKEAADITMSEERKADVRKRTEQSVRQQLEKEKLSTSYKMNKNEKSNAKKTAKDYFKNNDKARQIERAAAHNPNAARYLYEQMTPEEQQEYSQNVARSNKSKGTASFVAGAMEALPGYNALAKKADSSLGSQYGTDNNYGITDNINNAKTQNLGAYVGGEVASKLGQYMIANNLLSGVNGFDAYGKTMGNIMRGQVADTALDTLPNLINDVQEGKSKDQIALNALNNQALNFALNSTFEVLPMLYKSYRTLKNEGKAAADVADNLKWGLNDIEDLALDETLNKSPYTTLPALDDRTKALADEYANLQNGVKQQNPMMAIEPTISSKDAKQVNRLLDNGEPLAEQIKRNNSQIDALRKEQDALENLPQTEENIKRYQELEDEIFALEDENKVLSNPDALAQRTNYTTLPQTNVPQLDNVAPVTQTGNGTITVSPNLQMVSKTDDATKAASNVVDDAKAVPSLDNAKGAKKKGAVGEYDPELDFVEEEQNLGKGLVEQMDDSTTKGVPELNNNLPDANVKTPATVGGKMRQRGYANSLQTKTDLPEDVKVQFDDDMYRVLSNAETSAKADANYVEGDMLQSISNFNSLVKAKDPSAIPLGYRVANELISSGNAKSIDQGIDILETMSEELTKSGQFSQAAAITLMKSDPMASLRYMQRQIKSLNQAGAREFRSGWKDIALTQEEIEAFSKINPGDTEAISALYDSIKGRIGKEVPSTLWEKIVNLEKTAMLLNPLTHIKNVAANVVLMPIRSLSDRVSAIGQGIRYITGGKKAGFKRTQALLGGGAEEKKIASQFFDEIKDSVLGENKMLDTVKSDVLHNKQVFKDNFIGRWVNSATNGGIEKLNKVFGKDVEGNVMETISNFNMWMMGEVEDNPFVKANFVNRLASYMKAQGIKSAEDVPEEAVSLAIEEAMKATFKDDNAFTSALGTIKKKSGKFGEVVLPFTKTPANLAMRAIDYSPVGFASTIKNFKKTGNVAKFFDDLSKNAIGTAGIYLGYKLKESGILTGSYSEDKRERNYQKANGFQEFSINADKLFEAFGMENKSGKSYSYNWAQPAAIPLIIGTTIYDAVQNSDKELSGAMKALNATKTAAVASADRWLELSPLQSLKEVFTGDGYGEDSFGENVISTISDFPGRFIPSVMGATARTKDDTIRDTYDSTDSFESWKNSLKAKVPGMSDDLPASYDIWGRERTRSNSMGERIAEQFISPSKVGNENSVDIDGELQRLANSTNNSVSTLVPQSAGYSVTINKETRHLTNKEHSQYQQMKGSLSYDFAKAILSSDMSDETKADAISKAYSFADRIVKEKLFGYETTSDKALKEAYETKGVQGLVEYYAKKGRAEELGVKDTDAFEEAYEVGNEEQYAREYSAITSIPCGTKSSGETNYLKYNDNTIAIYRDKGEEGLKSYAEVRSQLPEGYNNDDLMSVVSNSNIPASDKAYFYINMKKGDLAAIPSIMDNVEEQYAYYVIKDMLDADGNGSLNKKEKANLIPMLSSMGLPEERINQIAYGTYQLNSGKTQTGWYGTAK